MASSGSSDQVEGAEKHEIYAATFGGGGMVPSTPLDPLLNARMSNFILKPLTKSILFAFNL